MSKYLGDFPVNATVYVYFDSYDGTTGASESISGLAVGDILIYKNGSITQRSSTNGYTLLDTDGIDFDGITGINGFSIDLSDNTDTGFYAAGNEYVIIISSITADGQTVNFIAAEFSIERSGAALALIKAGNLSANVVQISGDATAADNAEAFFDGTGYAGTNNVIPTVTSVTGAVSSVTAAVTVGTNNDKSGYALSAAGVQAIWDALTAALTTVGSIGKKLADWVLGTDNKALISTDVQDLSATMSVNTKTFTSTLGLTTQMKADVNAEVDSALDTAVPGSPTANSINERVKAIDDLTQASGGGDLAAIKTKTDNLPDGVQKNTALANFEFLMVDSSDHVTGKTGLAITATRSIDGAAFGACANVASEVANGIYKINLAAADLNGDVITFRFVGTGADDTFVTVKTDS